jgi:hypothetical protein
MRWEYNDGGRAEAGYKGTTGDCVCRAIAIAADLPYQEAYNLINEFAKNERPRGKKKRSHARTGVHKATVRKIMAHLGWTWVPTMKVGQGCKVHLVGKELPGGRLVVSCSRHTVAVIEGVVQDIYDPSREGSRCVYGYFHKGE